MTKLFADVVMRWASRAKSMSPKYMYTMDDAPMPNTSGIPMHNKTSIISKSPRTSIVLLHGFFRVVDGWVSLFFSGNSVKPAKQNKYYHQNSADQGRYANKRH